MKRLILLLCVLALVLPGAQAAFAGSSCTKPSVEPRYTDSEMTVVLIVDYTGCSWARGSQLLHGEMTKDSNLYAGGTEAEGGCHTECEFPLSIGHITEVAAVYEGTFRYEWRNAFKKVDFHYECTVGIGCL